MIDFDHSISNSSSHESNDLNSDFIGSKRSEDSEEIFKDDEFEDSEAVSYTHLTLPTIYSV